MIRSVYLAGPDVFLPDATTIGAAKREMCRRFGFEGRFPLDNEIELPGATAAELGLAICRANIAMMRECDAILANVTPFRSPSADVGTAFEVGFFAALGRPIFAYSSDPAFFAERTRASTRSARDAGTDTDGYSIEAFDLPDNLMLPGAVALSGGNWLVCPEPAGSPRLPAFAAFQLCLEAVRAVGATDLPVARAA